MYDTEDATAPYDNVEFPARQPGTGTWPGPATSGGHSPSATTGTTGGLRLYGQHSLSRAGVPKLATLVEMEGSDVTENNRHTTIVGNSVTSPTSRTTLQTNDQSQAGMLSLSGQTSANSVIKSTTTTSTTTTQSSTTTPTTVSSTSAVSSSASTTATNATATSTTTSTATSASSAKAATTTTTSATTRQSRPVISLTNNADTYAATQVSGTDTLSRKKGGTLKHADNEEEDFKRQDLNPESRAILERVYNNHTDFYQLNSKILDEGSLLKQDVLDIYRKSGETLTYEQLLQGMLVDGERFLLGSCWLYYTHVQFLDVEGTKTLREPYGRGRIGLTSKRTLFLSTETFTDATLEPFGDPNKVKRGGYKLEVSKRSNITFKNIPLSNFHSAEMEISAGTSAQTKITRNRMCCGCIPLSKSKWSSSPPMTRSIQSRVIRVGVSMPPWQTRMFMDIHLDSSMSLTVARDFISQLHGFAPHMH